MASQVTEPFVHTRTFRTVTGRPYQVEVPCRGECDLPEHKLPDTPETRLLLGTADLADIRELMERAEG